MLHTWFDERFLAAGARSFRQWRVRVAAGLGVGVMLAVAADWRPALAWAAAMVALEEALRHLTRPMAEGGKIEPLHAWGALVFQALLMTTWGFAGAIFWSGGGLAPTVAMGFFAALLLYVLNNHSRSPALAAAAVPALLAPVLTLVLAPPPGSINLTLMLIITLLLVGQTVASILRSLREEANQPIEEASSGPVRYSVAPPPPQPAPAEPMDEDELTLERLAEAKAEAEAANAAKSAFLATMSHEIRTPLNGVLGMTQALAADPTLNPSQRKRLAMIRDSGESLLAILNDILDLSKVEAGKLELESIEFDLAEVARGAHESFSALAAQKGLAFKLIIQPAAAGVYLGDPTRVRQILYNLISNALKFTEQGEIRVSMEQTRAGLRLTVADTGVGIEPAQLERLFQKFEQADASSTRRYGGTGLGLAICRELCGLMGGTIEAQSEPGKGASFMVTLPLHKVTETAAPAPSAAAAGAQEPDAGALRVLAAEDNATNQMVLKSLLAPIGVDPTVVDNGAQAVEAWRVSDFDLILMDIQMPEMDGLTAARTIRAEEARTGRPRTPIVALTANAMSHQVEEYFRAGMDAHVPKPIDMRTLYDTIQALRDQSAERQAEPRPARAAARR